ncbi:hypothetical protein [Desulfosporosinus metallidurans]|uniref:hypothetical protein n=1 Tax=Desulfosporosinus metallidurans TaxID=1888891 RepID=UPI0011152D6D|nr:hypothetical protein [Desulfosporosinus metallidurans]
MMKRFNLVAILLLILTMFNAHSVFAYTTTSSTPLALITSKASYQNLSVNIYADTTDNTATFTSIAVSWLIQTGDQVAIYWMGSSGAYTQNITNTLDSSLSGSNVTIPISTVGAPYTTCELVIYSSSNTGYRYMWVNSATNSNGNTAIFPDPDTSNYVPPSPPTPPPTTTCTL